MRITVTFSADATASARLFMTAHLTRKSECFPCTDKYIIFLRGYSSFTERDENSYEIGGRGDALEGSHIYMKTVLEKLRTKTISK
jgi:hypothetical protein